MHSAIIKICEPERLRVLSMNENTQADYIVIKALEDGVQIIGLTRGGETRLHHTEKIDANEIYIAQFTETVSAIKIRGKAQVYTKHGVLDTIDK